MDEMLWSGTELVEVGEMLWLGTELVEMGEKLWLQSPGVKQPPYSFNSMRSRTESGVPCAMNGYMACPTMGGSTA